MLDYESKREFAELGKKFQAIGILLLLGLIPYIGFLFSFISPFFTISALGKIKRISQRLNDQDLYKARKYYIYSYLVIILGIIVIIPIIVVAIMFLAIMGSMDMLLVFSLMITIIMVAIFIIFVFAFILEYKAWSLFLLFFEKHLDYFPKDTSDDALNGCNKIKTSVVLNFITYVAVLGFLAVFFMVLFSSSSSLSETGMQMEIMILGVILSVISYVGMGINVYRALGYFKLAHLQTLEGDYYQKYPSQEQGGYYLEQQEFKREPPVYSTEKTLKQPQFCPFCGSKTVENARFCENCGEKLIS